MGPLKWAGAILALPLWLITRPFAWANGALGRVLGFNGS
jgi:hypothetical protein